MTLCPPMTEISECRACAGPDLVTVRAFGKTPLADRLQDPAAVGPDYRAPLTLCHCTACGLCQLRETIAPRILFGKTYPYHSSVSPALLAHFADSAHAIMARTGLGPQDLVIEAASNDGYMLQAFQAAGHSVLGIDPADGPVREARRKGIDTLHDFFTAALARKLAASGQRARVFLANNVLAHVTAVNDFISGITTLLTDDGLAVIEVPYLLDLVDGGAFDTIYHQHLLYLSLTSLVPLFARHGLYLNDVERLWVHGGSLRLFLSRKPGQSARLETLLHMENDRGVNSFEFYQPFLNRIDRLADHTRQAINVLQQTGKTVAGYGAAAKATTLLHVLDLPMGALSCIFDKSPWKHGKTMPGAGLEIRPAETLSDRDVDAVLLLAWNFADEILAENAAYLEAGGRFLIPVPEFREVSTRLATRKGQA